MLINSIYFRMTFWYVLAVGLIALILSVCLYANFSRVLNKDFNYLLETRAAHVGQVVEEALLDRTRDRREGLTAAASNAAVCPRSASASRSGWSRRSARQPS